MKTLDRIGPNLAAGGPVARWLPPLFLLALGFWLVPLSHTCQLACVPGDLGDARFNGVVLEHFHRWLLGLDASLVSPPFFYPTPGASTFSDNHWGTAWIYSAYRAMGWDRYQAFDLWYLTGYIANFLVTHIVFRRLRFSPLASAVAAFAFTFAMPVIARHGHAQLTYRLLIPVGLLMWERFVAEARWRWMAGLALAVVGQFYISIYLGYFMLLTLTAWALSQWVIEGVGPRVWFEQWRQWRQPASRREVLSAVAAIILAALALALLMKPYLHFSTLYGFKRSIVEIASMLPRIQSYVLADQSMMWGAISSKIGADVPMRHEQQMFFGVGILALSALALIRSPLNTRWVAASTICLLVLLTLSVGGHSLYLLLAKLPGVGSVRAMARIGLVMALPLAVLVAMGVDALERGKVIARVILGLLILLMVFESSTLRTSNFDIAQDRHRVGELRSGLPQTLPSDVIVFNPIRPGYPYYISELDGAILGQDVGRPTLNGYSGNLPPGYEPREAETPCRQALIRLQAAQKLPPAIAAEGYVKVAGPVVVVDQPSCDSYAHPVFPLTDAGKVELRIVSAEKKPDGYLVKVQIRNRSDAALNAAPDLQGPLRLSWQMLGDGEDPDPSGWHARVELAGAAMLEPGEVREVDFRVPASTPDRRHIVVSAVIEGRAWLHEHGLVMQQIILGNAAP